MDRWIERQKNIIDFTLSSLLRRKRKNIALLFVYTLIVFLLASVVFFIHSLQQEASIILKGAPEMVVQRMVAGRHERMPLRYTEQIRGVRGISEARGRLWGYYYDPIIGANYTLMVPEAFQHGLGKIAIGAGVARTRLLDPGDEMEFLAHDGTILQFTLEEILSTGSELVSSDLVLLSEEDFRRLFGLEEGWVTDLVLRVKNQRELNTVALKIAKLLPDTRIILRDEILRTYEAIFGWRGGIAIVIFSGGILAFIIFAWDKASGLSAEEKREIGILKAIGWETSDVILMKCWEGTVISFSSFLMGILFAYLHIFWTSFFLFEPVLKGWAVLYPKFKLIPFIDASQIAILFFLTVVPYTVATIIPSWRAATVDPDLVMKA